MELRQIEVFLAVARELHFGHAARGLYLSQSTVSESVRGLEEEIGGLLFQRTSRRVELTPLGVQFRRDVEPGWVAVSTAFSDARRTARGEAPRLTVGFLGGGLYELTLPVVTAFHARFPDIEVEWTELSYVDQSQAVLDGTVDAAFCRLPVQQDGLVVGAPLLRDTRKLVVPAGHRLAQQQLIDPEELASERIPVVPADDAMAGWLEFHFPRKTPGGRPIAQGPTVRTVREAIAAVESGEAVVLMTGRAEGYYSNPNVRFVSIDLAPIFSVLVYRRGETRPAVLGLDEAATEVAKRNAASSEDADSPQYDSRQ